MRPPKFSVHIIIVIIVIILGGWMWARNLGFHRPYINWDPEDLAEYLIENKKSPEECWDLIVLDPFGPQPAVQRALCVYKVAQMTSNPEVCALLLPSEYGLACISNLWPDASGDVSCGLNSPDENIYICRNNDGTFRKSKNCDDFSNNIKQFSACLEDKAELEKNVEKCKEIPDEKIRTFCQVRLGAWEKYPQLRDSFYFGKQ